MQSQGSALDKVKQELRERLDEHINRREHSSNQSIAVMEKKLAGLAAKRQFLSQQLEEMTKKQENRKAQVVELAFVRRTIACGKGIRDDRRADISLSD